MNLETPNFENPESMDFKESVRRLNQALGALPNSLGEDNVRGAVNLEARSRAVTAAKLLMELPNNPSQEILGLREKMLHECKEGVDTIKYENEGDQSFLEKAKQSIEELENL